MTTRVIMAEQRPETIPEMFRRRTAQSGESTAMLVRKGDQWQPRTWSDLAHDVRRTAAAIESLGASPGDRIVQIAENRLEWIVADLAIQSIRAVHVPLHSTLAGEQFAYQIADSGARLVLIAGEAQAEKLRSCEQQIPADVRFVSYEPCGGPIAGRPIELLSDRIDALTDAKVGESLEERIIQLTPDDLATILYTSGTTGQPKGVMLSQRNLTSNALGVIDAFDLTQDDVRLCFLPLSHIFARTCCLYTWIAQGSQLAFAQSRETILEDCATVQPTVMNGVPYFFDKVYKALCGEADEAPPDALRGLLGGRMRMCCSGGAALPDHVARFFSERGVPLLQGYGLTETSPVITLSTPSSEKVGTVGRTIAEVDVRIADDGEILTRGPHVMLGYWNRPGDTAEVLCDGWFSTGDLGAIDEEGFLRITGRKKELIVTAAGKNVAPVLLESLLTEDPLIAQALVVGDGRGYLTALIVPDADALRSEIIRGPIPVATPAEAFAHAQVLALYEVSIAERLSGVSHHEQVRRFALLDRGFTIEEGQLTPTLKLRRKKIEEDYADRIEEMYGEQ